LIINEEGVAKIEETITSFQEDVGGTVYASDEYAIAMQMKEAIEQGEWGKLQAIGKKPLFSFLETEIVKAFKRKVMSAPGGG